MDTQIESPQEVIVRVLKIAQEAAEEGDWIMVNDICEQTILEIKELFPYWGKEESGTYPIIKQNE